MPSTEISFSSQLGYDRARVLLDLARNIETVGFGHVLSSSLHRTNEW